MSQSSSEQHNKFYLSLQLNQPLPDLNLKKDELLMPIPQTKCNQQLKNREINIKIKSLYQNGRIPLSPMSRRSYYSPSAYQEGKLTGSSTKKTVVFLGVLHFCSSIILWSFLHFPPLTYAFYYLLPILLFLMISTLNKEELHFVWMVLYIVS